MSYSIYIVQKLNKYKADVQYQGCRKTKTFAKKSDAKAWAIETERDMMLNHNTQLALSSTVKVISLYDALSAYARDVSPTKKTAKKSKKC